MIAAFATVHFPQQCLVYKPIFYHVWVPPPHLGAKNELIFVLGVCVTSYSAVMTCIKRSQFVEVRVLTVFLITNVPDNHWSVINRLMALYMSVTIFSQVYTYALRAWRFKPKWHWRLRSLPSVWFLQVHFRQRFFVLDARILVFLVWYVIGTWNTDLRRFTCRV